MNSIGAIVAWLVGCACGLAIIDMRPGGLEPLYGRLMLGAAFLALLPLWLGWSNRRTRWASIFLLALLAGGGRTMLVRPPISPADLAFYNSSERSTTVQVTGVVSAEPVAGDTFQRIRVSSRSILPLGRGAPVKVAGDMLILISRYPAYYIGDTLRLTGKLTVPPASGSFDYAGYLARRGIYSYMLYPKVVRTGAEDDSGLTQMVSPVRARVRAAIEAAMPEPQAALTVGVVTGDRTSIPQPVLDAFNRSGTTHILAISGQNVALLVGVLYLFFQTGSIRRRMPLWLLALALVLIGFYTIFTGASPSVIRAAIMSGVLLMSQAVGRRFDPISALAVSAAIMALADPNVLADGGFLLSFAAMLGLAQVSPFVFAALSKLKIPALLAVPLAAGVGAQGATAPLILLLTGRVSLVSPLASLTTEFALLPLMIAGIALGVFGAVSAPLGWLLGLATWPWASWMLASVQWWAALPAASLEAGTVGAQWIVPYYLLLALLIWWAREGKRRLAMSPYQIAFAASGLIAWSIFVGILLNN